MTEVWRWSNERVRDKCQSLVDKRESRPFHGLQLLMQPLQRAIFIKHQVCGKCVYASELSVSLNAWPNCVYLSDFYLYTIPLHLCYIWINVLEISF